MSTGRRTRGKTRPGRLRALDAWLVRRFGPLLRREDGPWADAPVVDLGFGAMPWTTVELADAVQAVAPARRVVGVDIDPARVDRAREQAPALAWHVGGFELPIRDVALVRAMNVLRQYKEPEVPAAHATLGQALLDGGVIVEGTTSKEGHVASALVLRRDGDALRREALWLATDFSQGFAPILFRDHLPRDLRRRVRPGEAVSAFFNAWTEAWQATRAGLEPHAAFTAAAGRLAEAIDGLVLDDVDEGVLVWAPAAGVPRPGEAPAPRAG